MTRHRTWLMLQMMNVILTVSRTSCFKNSQRHKYLACKIRDIPGICFWANMMQTTQKSKVLAVRTFGAVFGSAPWSSSDFTICMLPVELRASCNAVFPCWFTRTNIHTHIRGTVDGNVTENRLTLIITNCYACDLSSLWPTRGTLNVAQ